MVIGFTVNDPRLKFPPKNAKPTMSFDGNPETTIILPSCKLAQSDLWDDSIRNGLAKPKYKKKDIDNRRSENTVPGTPLMPLRQDDRIPVLLIQRSVETPESNNDQARHGWTLMFPAGWSMAFFSSLIYTGTRVAGQFERQTQAYEAGTAYFPRDYPFAETYEIYAQDLEEKRKSNWERKPPAKRPNYKKLGVLSPWRADWEKVLGLPSRKIEAQKDVEDVFSTQNDITMDRSIGQNAPVVHPWLLRGSEVTKLFANMSSVFNPSAALFTHVNRLRLKRNMQPLSSDIKPNDFFQSALINVKVTMNLRGVPEDLAAIYSLPDDVYKKWANLIHAGKAKMANQVIDEDGNIIDDDEENPDEVMLANRLQKESVIIGHVTTGHYSLARGEGFAIGAVALARLLDLDQQATRLHHRQKGPPMLVVVRNNNSRQCRVGTLQVVEA